MDESLKRAAESKIDHLFQVLSERLFTGRPGPPSESLPGIFYAASGQRDPSSIRILKPYLASLKHHLDSRASAAKADVLRALGEPDPELALKAAQERIEGGVQRVLEAESTALRNAGSLAAVERHADSLGIEDPVVVFIVHRIGACSECLRLHQTETGEPRAWLQSELGSGYHKKGEDNPKLGGLHPLCRCSLIFIPPGWGYKNGRLAYVSKDYSLLDAQRTAAES